MIPPGLHRFPLLERIVHGQPAARAIEQEIDRLGRRRPFLVTNASVARSALLARLQEALGPRLAGLYAGVTAHGPRQCVIDGASAARAAGADILLAVGGGSVIDAAKVMQLCLRHDLERAEQLSDFAAGGRPDPSTRPADADRWLRVIAVPTTLSAAEFTWWGGAYDPARRVKEAFASPLMMPQVVVLDPALTLETPEPLLLATGMKAVDHAAERLGSLAAHPYSDAVSSLALRLLATGLRTVRRSPDDLAARGDLQYGAFLSICGGWTGATVGLGHAIGHALGAHCGVAHGHTSCILLPAVMQWTAPSNRDRQRLIAKALDSNADAAGALAALIDDLSLPRRLRDVGVERTAFSAVAEKAMADPLTRNSPRPVSGTADIEEVLELAW